jgi:hypothetical protein
MEAAVAKNILYTRPVFVKRQVLSKVTAMLPPSAITNGS